MERVIYPLSTINRATGYSNCGVAVRKTGLPARPQTLPASLPPNFPDGTNEDSVKENRKTIEVEAAMMTISQGAGMGHGAAENILIVTGAKAWEFQWSACSAIPPSFLSPVQILHRIAPMISWW
jgi:hypothetical protein